MKTEQTTFLSSNFQPLLATSKWWFLIHKNHGVCILYDKEAIYVFDPYCHKVPDLISDSYVVSLKSIQEFNMFMFGLFSTIDQDFSPSDMCYLHCVNITQPKVIDKINTEWFNLTSDITMPVFHSSDESVETENNESLKYLIDIFHKAVQQDQCTFVVVVSSFGLKTQLKISQLFLQK